MADILDKLSKEAEELKTLRDELRVKLDLGRMEARDLWEKAEKAWSEHEKKLVAVSHETGDALREVGVSVRKILSDIREDYRKIRKQS